MKKDYEHVSILLDRSGSMQGIKNDVIGGFNSFIEEQKKVPGEMSVSLMSFASAGETVTMYDTVKLADVKPLDHSNYITSGSTALNDAFAKLIADTGVKLAAMKEDDRPDKVLVVCITDGEENDSKEHTTESLKKIIEERRQHYNWEFMYIGANQDSFHEANLRGIKNSTNFMASSTGTKKMYQDFSESNVRYRAGGDL